jgi:hypothetical protein
MLWFENLGTRFNARSLRSLKPQRRKGKSEPKVQGLGGLSLRHGGFASYLIFVFSD